MLTPAQHKAKIEKAQRAQQEYFKTNPMDWLRIRMLENPQDFKWSTLPGYENHKWDGDVDPLYQAWQVIADGYLEVKRGKIPKCRYAAIESATGCSKTYMLARVVAWFLDCFENSLVVTSAPSETQLKIGLWSEISTLFPKIKAVRPFAEKWKLRMVVDNRDTNIANSHQAVGFITGTTADEESSNKSRGFHRKNMLIILEEHSGIPMSIVTAFQNTSTGNTNFILGVGNPNNEFDALHQFAIQSDVKNFRISALDYPNIVLKQEIYAGAVTEVSIQARTSTYGKGSALWNAMVRGLSPKQGADSLIMSEWIEACINISPESQGDEGYNAVGVDVANSEDGDKACTVYGKNNHLKAVYEFKCPNATHLAANLYLDDTELIISGKTVYNIPNCYDYDVNQKYIGIDSVGVGVATVNAFLDYGWTDVQSLSGGSWKEAIPTDENDNLLYSFSNLRSQMYFALREDIRNKRISIDVKDVDTLNQIRKELCIPKFSAAGGKIAIESKEAIKKRLGKSPNVMDAIVYWNWTRKGIRVTTDIVWMPIRAE